MKLWYRCYCNKFLMYWFMHHCVLSMWMFIWSIFMQSVLSLVTSLFFYIIIGFVEFNRTQCPLAKRAFGYLQTTLKKLPALHFGPGENSHIFRCRMVLERFPVSLCKQPWSKIEKENLAKGIKQQYQEMLILNSMNVERYVFALWKSFFLFSLYALCFGDFQATRRLLTKVLCWLKVYW